MSGPLISVIIPCYNGRPFIAEALESVLAQRYPNLEIIVVDDGSTDDSADIVARYAQVYCIRQINAGVATARNTGLRRSSGQYIVFLDQDDRLLPNALESNLRCLLDHPDCAFVFGDIQSIDKHGAPLPHRSASPEEGKRHYRELMRRNHIWTLGAVMYRRSVLGALSGFDASVGPATDWALNLPLARRCPVWHNRTTVLEYRMHGGNSSSDYALMLRSTMTVLHRQKRWVQQDRRAKEALREGSRYVQGQYGNLIITQLVGDLRQRKWRRGTWSDTAVLLRYAPLVLFLRVARRAGRVLKKP